MIYQDEITADTETAWYAIRVDQRGLSLRQMEGSVRSKVPDSISRPLGFPIEEILRRRNFNPFIPVESIFIRRNRYRPTEKRRVKRAILPGMVFLNLPTRDFNWYTLITAPMVHGVFGLRGVPYRFDDDDLERLVAISADLRQPDFYRPMPTRRVYEVGDDVVDVSGLFEGTMEVIEITGGTAKVLAPFFGEMREITMKAAQLAKAPE